MRVSADGARPVGGRLGLAGRPAAAWARRGPFVAGPVTGTGAWRASNGRGGHGLDLVSFPAAPGTGWASGPGAAAVRDGAGQRRPSVPAPAPAAHTPPRRRPRPAAATRSPAPPAARTGTRAE